LTSCPRRIGFLLLLSTRSRLPSSRPVVSPSFSSCGVCSHAAPLSHIPPCLRICSPQPPPPNNIPAFCGGPLFSLATSIQVVATLFDFILIVIPLHFGVSDASLLDIIANELSILPLNLVSPRPARGFTVLFLPLNLFPGHLAGCIEGAILGRTLIHRFRDIPHSRRSQSFGHRSKTPPLAGLVFRRQAGLGPAPGAPCRERVQ
jgi:hypothetical protein